MRPADLREGGGRAAHRPSINTQRRGPRAARRQPGAKGEATASGGVATGSLSGHNHSTRGDLRATGGARGGNPRGGNTWGHT